MNVQASAREHFWKATALSFDRAEQKQMSVTLDGVTFRWDGEELLVTTATSQKRLTGSSAATLLDFLLAIQQDLYTTEQARELPTWAHPPRRFANGQVSEEQPLRLTSGTTIISKPDG